MLVILGFLMIATFMVLIMTKKLTPVLALIIVPTAFGLFAGAGFGIGDMVMKAIEDMSSTAALLMFAIVYFGLMINVGLFDPLVKLILRKLGNDPAKIVLGTALLSGAVSLDGDGSTTFIVVTAALLPVYMRLGLSPVVLTCVAGLTNGTLNIVPWGGPTARASVALNVPASDIFVPLVPSLIAGLAVSLGFAWMLGLRERRRLRAEDPVRWSREPAMAGVGGSAGSSGSGSAATGGGTASGGASSGAGRSLASAAISGSAGALADTALDPNRESLRPKLIWFNLALTVAIMVMLVVNVVPLPFVFMVGCAVALVVNFPNINEQARQLASHATSVISVVAMVLAAGVLTGVLSGTGMVGAMSAWLVDIIPSSMGPHMAVITALLSIPMTFFMSNDAFYFGVLPVLSDTAAHFGVAPVEMARASVIGQPVHLQSPLVPAILLLVSLAGVDLGDHHKKVLWRALVVALVMLAVGIALAVIPFG